MLEIQWNRGRIIARRIFVTRVRHAVCGWAGHFQNDFESQYAEGLLSDRPYEVGR